MRSPFSLRFARLTGHSRPHTSTLKDLRQRLGKIEDGIRAARDVSARTWRRVCPELISYRLSRNPSPRATSLRSYALDRLRLLLRLSRPLSLSMKACCPSKPIFLHLHPPDQHLHVQHPARTTSLHSSRIIVKYRMSLPTIWRAWRDSSSSIPCISPVRSKRTKRRSEGWKRGWRAT